MSYPIDECPYCGCEVFFIKGYAYGSAWYHFHLDGETQVDNSTMHDFLKYRGGKVAYCQDCGKRLFDMMEVAE